MIPAGRPGVTGGGAAGDRGGMPGTGEREGDTGAACRGKGDRAIPGVGPGSWGYGQRG